MNFEEMKRQLDGLVVFRELLRDEAVAMFREVLQDRCRNDGDAFTTHCGEFVFRLFQQGDCWTEYLRSAVMESENVCIRNWASGTVTALQERCLDRELAFLDQLSQVTLADLTAGLDNAPAFLEGWRTEPGSIAQDYRQRMQEVGAKGYGIFARYHMFTVENGQLVPVKHPDPQQLEQLPGYEQERQKVLAANLERNRIGTAMQAEVLNTLESVIPQADDGLAMLNSEPAPDSEQIIAAFTVIGERGRAALAHMRQLLTVLRETGFSDEMHEGAQPDMQLRPAAPLSSQMRQAESTSQTDSSTNMNSGNNQGVHGAALE